MRKKVLFFVLFMVSSRCDSHERPPSVLGGLLSGAHELRTKVHNVLGGLAQGALNLGGHLEINHVQPGHAPTHHQYPVPNNGGYRPEKPTETIIVVVESNDHPHHNHHHHGHPPHGHNRPPNFNYPNRPGYGYGPPNSEPWNDNNYNRPPSHRPGYGYNPQGQPNFNGNPYNNNNENFNQNNYGRPNNENFNQHHGSNTPTDNGNDNQNTFVSPPPSPNNGNHNQNSYNAKPPPKENIDQNEVTKPPTFNNGGLNQNNYANIPNSPPPFENKPTFEFSTKQPEKPPQFGSIYDVNKENANNIPTRKPDTNVHGNEFTTKKPDDDLPLFVPLNPSQYQYGGDKVEANAPKRETNPEPIGDENESYPIDVRFGERKMVK